MVATLVSPKVGGGRDISSIPKEPEILERTLAFRAPEIPKRIAAKEYARFSEQYLGEFIHHVPSVDEPTTAKYTESRMAAEFLLGSLNSKIWPEGGMADCCQSIPSCSECQPPCGSDGDG